MLKNIARKLGPLKALAIAGKAGRVTRKYPFEAPLLSEEFRGKIDIDENKCIGCGACVNACPPNALTIEEKDGVRIIKYFIGRCIYCWRCIDVCPVGAIRGTTEFELATDNLSDLYELIVHDVVRCKVCGKPVSTVAMKNYVLNKVPVSEEYIDMDPECRKQKLLKAIMRGVGYGEE